MSAMRRTIPDVAPEGLLDVLRCRVPFLAQHSTLRQNYDVHTRSIPESAHSTVVFPTHPYLLLLYFLLLIAHAVALLLRAAQDDGADGIWGVWGAWVPHTQYQQRSRHST
eukprot:22478-Rhodomonas_salina.2